MRSVLGEMVRIHLRYGPLHGGIAINDCGGIGCQLLFVRIRNLTQFQAIYLSVLHAASGISNASSLGDPLHYQLKKDADLVTIHDCDE